MLGVDSASDLVRLPFRLGFGALHGTGSAIVNRRVDPALGKAVITADAAKDPAVYLRTQAFINKHIGTGIEQILGSGILNDLRGIFQKGGLNTVFEVLTGSGKAAEAIKAGTKAALGLRGIGVLLAGGILAGVGVYFGSTLAMESWKKVTQLNQGKRTDLVANPWVHGAHALTGLAMAVGGAMAFIPGPTMAYGAGLAVSGFLGAMVLHGVRFVMGGQHILRYYELLPYPFDKLAEKFTNKESY